MIALRERIAVSTAQEVFAWTEMHPTIDGEDWLIDLVSDDPTFIVAIPVPALLGDLDAVELTGSGRLARYVGFFAATQADAIGIRTSIF